MSTDVPAALTLADQLDYTADDLQRTYPGETQRQLRQAAALLRSLQAENEDLREQAKVRVSKIEEWYLARAAEAGTKIIALQAENEAWRGNCETYHGALERCREDREEAIQQRDAIADRLTTTEAALRQLARFAEAVQADRPPRGNP